MPIPIDKAVDLLYHGRSNLIHAAKAAEVDPDVLKRLLKERVKESPNLAPLQLHLPIF